MSQDSRPQPPRPQDRRRSPAAWGRLFAGSEDGARRGIRRTVGSPRTQNRLSGILFLLFVPPPLFLFPHPLGHHVAFGEAYLSDLRHLDQL